MRVFNRLVPAVVASAVIAVCLLPTIVFAVCPTGKQDCAGSCIPISSLCLLEPLPGMGSRELVPNPADPLGMFTAYVGGGVWQWAFGMGVAFAILNGVFAGFRIVMSNGDSGEIGAAKTQFLWSAIGLIILLLAGVILQFLNPMGFVNL